MHPCIAKCSPLFLMPGTSGCATNTLASVNCGHVFGILLSCATVFVVNLTCNTSSNREGYTQPGLYRVLGTLHK